MSALYESIKRLCDERGIKPGKMCTEIGISRGLISDLKSGRTKSITSETAHKIADYFGVSVDRVLGTEQKKEADPLEGTDFKPTKEYWEKAVSKMSKEEMREAMDILMKKYVEEENK